MKIMAARYVDRQSRKTFAHRNDCGLPWCREGCQESQRSVEGEFRVFDRIAIVLEALMLPKVRYLKVFAQRIRPCTGKDPLLRCIDQLQLFYSWSAPCSLTLPSASTSRVWIESRGDLRSKTIDNGDPGLTTPSLIRSTSAPDADLRQ